MMGSAIDERVGGMQLPHSVGVASCAFFHAANPATMSYLGLTIGAANLLLAHGSDEQLETWVRPMVEGRYLGTMCLSETQAGSSLADLSTRAVRQPDGTYRLFGSKMWISENAAFPGVRLEAEGRSDGDNVAASTRIRR